MTDPQEQRVALAFLERFWSDRDAGREPGLTEYLGLLPGHEEVVAREYLQAFAELRGEGGDGEPAGSGEDRLGPYRLIKELGRGGQGVVWLAEDARLGRRVALKVLSGLGPGAESHLARFRREAELASKLDHPGICGVHDTGIEGGVPYIAMRLVDGETLADKLSRLGSSGDAVARKSFLTFDDDDDDAEEMPAEEPVTAAKTSVDRAELDRTIAIFEQAATALHAAHEVGIVHRDIKPGNLMISQSGQPVLLDFGLARDDSDDAGPSLTQTGDLFGTPAYMSPEQITGRRVRLDRRSDIYSLGVTLYECLTLKRPFEAPTRESLYQAILSKEAQPARRLNRQIPADLEVVLQCAMDKDRDKRYQTATDFAEDLRRVRSGEPILAKKVSLAGRAWRWSKRRPAAAALLAVLFLGVPTISGLGVWYWTHLDDVRAQERAQILEAVEDQLEIGFYELHHGDPKTALAAFEKALAIDADTPEAVAGLALSHRKLGKPEVALEVLERAERRLASFDVLIPVKADVLRSLGKIALADALLSDAPKVEGALGWFIAGTRAMDRGHALGEETPNGKAAFTEAEGHLHRAVLASPRPRRAYHFELAHARGHCECEGAAVAADAVEALWAQSAVAWRWSGFATMRVDPQRTVAALSEAIRLKPDDALAHRSLGRALGDQGNLDEAVSAFREAIRLKPDYAEAHNNLGDTLLKQDKLADAVAAFREAIRLNPYDAIPHNNLGVALKRQGRLADAVAACREAIRLKPDHAEARINLGLALSEQGKLADAVAACREAIRLKPDHAEAHNNLGNALSDQGKLAEAGAAFREAIRLKPDHAEAHNNLGNALQQQGILDEAIVAYREAIRLKPELALPHSNLGSALARQGRLEEGIAAFREAIRLKPELALPYSNLGLALAEMGILDEAIAAVSEAIRLKPDSADAHFSLGVALYKQGKLDEAVTALRAAARLAPDNRRVHGVLDLALGQTASSEDRVAKLRESLERDSENANLLNELAWMLVDPAGDASIRDPKEALPLARDAVELTNRLDTGILDTLAVALAASGEIKEAVAVQEELLKLMNGKDVPGMTVADAEAALDRYRKALAAQDKEEGQSR